MRDLRRQHQQQAQRDEGYPFMLTERRGRVGSLSGPSNCGLEDLSERSSRPSTRPLSSSPPPPLSLQGSCKRARSCSLDEESERLRIMPTRSMRLGSVPSLGGGPPRHRKGLFTKNYSTSSVDISTSIVPEDLEICVETSSQEEAAAAAASTEAAGPTASNSMEEEEGLTQQQQQQQAYLRKRSSSLPRILPPIFDNDDDQEDPGLLMEDEDVTQQQLQQMDQTSNLIVREMQKFVCRHAADVSQVLPLPLPTNSRQLSRLHMHNNDLNNGHFKNKNRLLLDWTHTQLLLKTLAKWHALAFALKLKAPGLFQEIFNSLASSPGAGKKKALPGALEDRQTVVQLLKTSTPLAAAADQDEQLVLNTVQRQAKELYADMNSQPFFPVVVYGGLSVKGLAFKYPSTPGSKNTPVGLRLPSLRYAFVGSPLIDIYSALFGCAEAATAGASTVASHLQTYHASFVEVATHFRIKVSDFSLHQLESEFKKYELTGMLLTALAAAAKTKQLQADKKLTSSKRAGLAAGGRSCSVGGKDMLLDSSSRLVGDLGSHLDKLVLSMPFSHQEEDEDDQDIIRKRQETNEK